MISIVIPTLNEKKNVTKIARKLSNIKIISEIIFVDDNSNDGTIDEINKIKSKKKIKAYLRKSRVKDLSRSVIYGIKKTDYKTILVMDCDLQHDVGYILKMWKKFNSSKCDVVVASRFLKKKFSGNLGIFRSIISNIAVDLINFSFGKKTSDPLSGFFICDKKIVLRYQSKFFSKGYKILFDILYNGKDPIKVVDQVIIFRKRNFDKSKFNLRIIWLFLKQMMYTKFIVKK